MLKIKNKLQLILSFCVLIFYTSICISQNQANEQFSLGQLPRDRADMIHCGFGSNSGHLASSVLLDYNVEENSYRMAIDGPMYCFEPMLAPGAREQPSAGKFTIYFTPSVAGAALTPEKQKARNDMFWRCYEQALIFRGNNIKNSFNIKIRPGQFFRSQLGAANTANIIVYLDVASSISCEVGSFVPPL